MKKENRRHKQNRQRFDMKGKGGGIACMMPATPVHKVMIETDIHVPQGHSTTVYDAQVNERD